MFLSFHFFQTLCPVLPGATFGGVISKVIRQKLEEKFGAPIRYSKQCEALSVHIFEECRQSISASTLRRLLGFVSSKSVPREYSLDVLAAYIGHKSWAKLLESMDKGNQQVEKVITSLKPEQLKKGQVVNICYAPGRKISLRKDTGSFLVVSSNEKRLLLNDEVTFQLIELEYPLTLNYVLRKGESIGRMQLATVSGITSITKC